LPRIEESSLPGVGVRYEFSTEDGRRIGVVHHRTGRRELFVCEADDTDAAVVTMNLTDEDSHALSEALGGSTLVANLTNLQQQVEGLAIDWLTVEERSPYATGTIGDGRIRTRSGVSVVAVIRRDQTFPAPGPEFALQPGDKLVVVGTPEGIEQAQEILSSG
jgi:TrkA domain protein